MRLRFEGEKNEGESSKEIEMRIVNATKLTGIEGDTLTLVPTK